MTLWRTLIRTHRVHQAELAARVTLLTRLDRSASDWQTLFARPEWQAPDLGHSGRCGLCPAKVGKSDAVCAACGAAWQPVLDRRYRWRRAGFTLASGVTAIVVAVVCHQRFTLYRLGIAADRVNAEFLQVMGNMLSLLGGVLVLALATLIFERGGLVPKGRWVAPSDDRQVPQKV